MKRYFVACVSVVLAVTLSIYSCFAITPVMTTVQMADPYGVSAASLAESDDYIYFTTSSEIGYGGWYYSSSSYMYYSTLAAGYTFYSSPLSSNLYPLIRGSVGSSTTTNYGMYYRTLQVPSSSYIDVYISANYPVDVYSSIVFSGTLQFALACDAYPYGSGYLGDFLYPDKVQVLVNDSVVGSKISASDSLGNFTIPSVSVSLSSGVYSVGYRFYFTSGANSNTQALNAATKALYGLVCYYSDNSSIVGVEAGSSEILTRLDTIISWLNTISSAVTNIKTYTNNIKSYTNTIKTSVSSILSNSNSMNSTVVDILTAVQSLTSGFSSLGTGIDKLVSVFARDDDIQLRDDVDPLINSATDFFYSSDTPGSVTTTTIKDTQTALSGAVTGFQSGYSSTDAFYEIAGSSDDYLSWFSSDTAGWLDTTVSAVSDDDEEDKFNHWRVDQQYAEIRRRRGEGD